MTDNVHRLKVPRKMRGRNSKPPEILDNLVELPLPDSGEITPQALLTKLSRYAAIDNVTIAFTSVDPETGGERVHVYTSNMANNEVLWVLEKAKLQVLGVIE